MNLKPTFYATVENGRLNIKDRQFFKSYLHTLKGDVEIKIEKPSKNRSQRENRYYWGVLIPILGDYFGYTKDEMHDALKWKFLRKQQAIQPRHKELPTVKSTATLSTQDFEQLMSEIRMWASTEFNVFIPLPNEPE